MALASSILKDKAPWLSEVRPKLPAQLGRICDPSLEKDPNSRFQTVREVQTQLQVLRREPAREVIGVDSSPPVAYAGRMKWIAAEIAMLLVLVLAGYLGWMGFFPSGPDTTSQDGAARKMITVLSFENLGIPEKLYFVDVITEEITSRMAGLEGLGVISRTSAMMYEGARIPLAQIGKKVGVGYVLEGPPPT